MINYSKKKKEVQNISIANLVVALISFEHISANFCFIDCNNEKTFVLITIKFRTKWNKLNYNFLTSIENIKHSLMPVINYHLKSTC